MDPVTLSALIGGGSSLMNSASSMFGNALSYKNTKRLMNMQNSFTERMSSTAYQRATSDMRAAGLNPALMYGSGSAASTPAAGNASFAGPDLSKFDIARNVADIVNARSQAKQSDANARLADQQALTEANKRQNLDADTAYKTAENIRQDKHLDNETRKVAAEVQNLIAQSKLAEEIAKFTGFNAETGRIQANAATSQAQSSAIQANSARENSITNRRNSIQDRYSNPVKAFVNRLIDLRYFGGSIPLK